MCALYHRISIRIHQSLALVKIIVKVELNFKHQGVLTETDCFKSFTLTFEFKNAGNLPWIRYMPYKYLTVRSLFFSLLMFQLGSSSYSNSWRNHFAVGPLLCLGGTFSWLSVSVFSELACSLKGRRCLSGLTALMSLGSLTVPRNNSRPTTVLIYVEWRHMARIIYSLSIVIKTSVSTKGP